MLKALSHVRADPRSIFHYDEEVIGSILRALGGDLDGILLSLIEPPKRLYLRVNLMRASREEVIDLVEREGYRAYEDEDLEEAVYIPVEGPYDIEPTGRIVIADKRASESVMMGSNLYSPGVLSCNGVKEGEEVTVVSDNGIPVAVGVARTSCEGALKLRRGVFVEIQRSLYRAPPIRELRVWQQGLVYPQSFPSMVASKILAPGAGEVVVDMCAAPGGKASHIYELSRGEAVVYAIDHSARRIEEMVENFKRLGHIGGIKIYRLDARYLSRDLSIRADKVIIDPPCTATGVKPKLWHRVTSGDMKSLASYQKQFLGEASRILKNGGVIVYSTCSITYDENEAIIEEIIEGGDFEILEPPYWVRKRGIVTSRGMIRFDPRSGHPGFFIAALKKST